MAEGEGQISQMGQSNKVASSTWSEWWSYEGISGPNFWGVINPDWTLCTQGKYQSPIDIDPNVLLYDPNLRPLNFTPGNFFGDVINTGHDLTIYLRPTDEENELPLITGGPLTYKYRLHRLIIHFGASDDRGSEHRIAGKAFPLEIQLVAYNDDLFLNINQASRSSFGIMVLSLLGQVHEPNSKLLETILQVVPKLRYKDYSQSIPDLALGELVPNTSHYITYEGSLTHPGCQEVVTWIILNKPFFVSTKQLDVLRSIYKVDETKDRSKMENNFRPVKALNNRTVRTNIRPQQQKDIGSTQHKTRRDKAIDRTKRIGKLLQENVVQKRSSGPMKLKASSIHRAHKRALG
ncbi:carbonic anhydrase-related protein 10-like [Liolophura sinensis]|uniref:carbonic anhydrase-related protein 10-like n=1 Tax=Liolophura sinensis TaxID=3198878 RepID=UPI0031588CDD